MTNHGQRLLMVGLDAFPPELLEQWCDEGTLPNLAALRSTGAYGYVDSPARILPGAVWPDFAACAPPSVHGLFHYLQWDHNSMSFRRPGPEWLDLEPFWYKLAGQGAPVVAFDVPFSFARTRGAPDKVVEAHGWGPHDEIASPFSSPAALLQELRTRARSGLRPDVLGPKSASMLRRELAVILESVRQRMTLIEHLAQRSPWQLFLAVFPETHRAGHYYWGSRVTNEPFGGLKQVAIEIDSLIPRLRALVPDGRLLLFSLHGMGPNYDFDRFTDSLRDYFQPNDASPKGRFDPVGLLHRHLPRGVRRAISAMLPTVLRDRLFSHYLASGRDWSNEKAIFPPGDIYVYARANLIGRERDGILSPEEAATHLTHLSEELSKIMGPSGELVVEEVVRLADVFPPGPRSDYLPDIAVRHRTPFNGDVLVMPDGRELRVPWRDGRDGTHLETGFYLECGPGAKGFGLHIAGHELARAACTRVGLSF